MNKSKMNSQTQNSKQDKQTKQDDKLDLWKRSDMVSFNLSTKEFSYAIMGWCKFLIRPYIEPYTKLKLMDRFKICGEENYYICRVEGLNLFDTLEEAITPENCRKVWFDSAILSLHHIQQLASLQVYNRRYKEYVKQTGTKPRILLIHYSLNKDPKL